jgi:hypothetical protein
MRLALFWFSVVTLLPSTLTAQQPKKQSAFVLAVGPTWNDRLTGLHLRGQYELVPGRWFGLRVEAGGRWTPNQYYSRPAIDGIAPGLEAWTQEADVHLGLSATLAAPLPGPVAPYLVIGAAAVQRWVSGTYLLSTYPGGGLGPSLLWQKSSSTSGVFAPIGGVGMRVRLGGRPVQVEARVCPNLGHMYEVTIGTVLRF